MQVRPSQSFIRELVLLGSIDPSQVGVIRQALLGDAAVIQRPEGLIAAVSLETSNEVAQCLVRQCLAFVSMLQQQEVEKDELVGPIRSMVEELDEVEREAAKRGFDTLLLFVDLESIQRTAKAIDLSYDCSNLLQRTRVLTDVRPLFSKDGKVITGAVVAHTLRLRFDNAGVSQELSVALDENDLQLLQKQCERSLVKAETARREFCNRAGVPSLTAQENSNG